MEVDQKDTSRANKVDLEKVTADINAAKALAAQVCRLDGVAHMIIATKPLRASSQRLLRHCSTLKSSNASQRMWPARARLATPSWSCFSRPKSTPSFVSTSCCCPSVAHSSSRSVFWKTVITIRCYIHPNSQVVQAFVRQAMGYMDQLPSQGEQVELIKTLQAVTEGKVWCIGDGETSTHHLSSSSDLCGDRTGTTDTPPGNHAGGRGQHCRGSRHPAGSGSGAMLRWLLRWLLWWLLHGCRYHTCNTH